MKLTTTKAQASLSELGTTARGGEPTTVTAHAEPAVESDGHAHRRKTSFDWEKWDEDCRRLGLRDIPPEEVEAMIAALEDSELSRRILGLEDP